MDTPPQAGGQAPAQPGTPTPAQGANPPGQNEMAELRAKLSETDKRLADKDRHITELRQTLTALEKRISSQPQGSMNVPVVDSKLIKAQADKIMESAGNDPEAASEALSKLLESIVQQGYQRAVTDSASHIEPAVQRMNFAQRVRNENKDLVELGYEPIIVARATEIMQSGTDFESSISMAVREIREKLDKLRPTTPAGQTPPAQGGQPPPAPAATPPGAPSGAFGEMPPSNQPPSRPAVTPEKSETQERLERQAASGLR